MKKGLIWFTVIIAISIFIGLVSDNYMGGIITFVVIGLIAIVIHINQRAQRTRVIARKLLKEKNPDVTAINIAIEHLGGTLGDAEAAELIRQLMVKRDSLAS